MIKLALLFLTVGDIGHQEYWKDFLKGHEQQYSIYVHAKNPLPDESFFKPYELGNTVPTTWANTMKAQIEMLKQALKDPDNQLFIFLSESALPLQRFDKIYKILSFTCSSYFSYVPNPHQDPADKLYDRRNMQDIPKQYRYKCSQWVILNRKHAQKMVEDRSIIEKIIHYEADNELYPATLVASHGLLDEIIPKDKTYVNWSKVNYCKEAVHEVPFIFSDFKKNDELKCIVYAIHNGFFFARKLLPTADLSKLDLYLPYRKHRYWRLDGGRKVRRER